MKVFTVIAAAAMLSASAVQAQVRADTSDDARLGIDRVGSYLSYTWVDNAHGGWDLGAELDIGSIIVPNARIVLGVNYLKADVDRPERLGPVQASSFHDFSTTADLRLTLFRWHHLEPFVGAGIGGHYLGNDIAGDDSLRRRYRGAKLGAQYFGGAAFDLTSDRSWSGYVELRRIEVPEVGRTTLRVGAFVRI